MLHLQTLPVAPPVDREPEVRSRLRRQVGSACVGRLRTISRMHPVLHRMNVNPKVDIPLPDPEPGGAAFPFAAVPGQARKRERK